MTYYLQSTLFQMGFWITWALIPLVIEVIPTLFSIITSVKLKITNQNNPDPKLTVLPLISIIIPVHNSEKTLRACLQSLSASTYPNQSMQILIADNGSIDDSSKEYDRIRTAFPQLNMQYFKTIQTGKSIALNAALSLSSGSYIINIDSDGYLEPNALINIIQRFANKPDVSAITGTILTQKETIKNNPHFLQRFLQKNEYFEYSQAFLAQRSVDAKRQQLFSMSGAFSAFRREVLLQTQLYQTDTVSEDTEMTFQIKDRLNGKVDFCESAIFFSTPVSNLNELYLQRQRWQRGELEILSKYRQPKTDPVNPFKKWKANRLLLLDHTFVFPKVIWLFASIVLIILGYSLYTIILSYAVIYCLYLFLNTLNMLISLDTLKPFTSERKFLQSLWWCIFTFPFYNFGCGMIRLIGILNSTMFKSSWDAVNLSQEMSGIKNIIHTDLQKLKKKVNQ